MRSTRMKVGSRAFALLLLAALILPITVAYAAAERSHARHAVDDSLTAKVDIETAALKNYFERARAITLLSSRNPAFQDFYDRPASQVSELRSDGAGKADINEALSYLESLYPSSIGEACFIDRGGAENARVVRGQIASPADLSPDESGNPFFGPTFAIGPGKVYQAEPYVSPDTHEWVISNSSVIPTRDGYKDAFVHFEITLSSFQVAARRIAGSGEIDIVDRTGRVVLSSELPQRVGAPLGEPGDHKFSDLARTGPSAGLVQWDHSRSAYSRLPFSPGNANHWMIVASGPTPAGFLAGFSFLSILLCLFALGLFATTLLSFRSSHNDLEEAVITDALTGLGNRRKLLIDMDAAIASATPERATGLILCDLDGFKTYNDTFGHPAGDQLLATLGSKVQVAVMGVGQAYRMGGDEFCALVDLRAADASTLMNLVAAALTEEGDGFHIRCSRGVTIIPTETTDSAEALRMADRRMYQNKNNARGSAGGQSAGVLLQAIRETDAILGDHVSVVAGSAESLGRKLGLNDNALRELQQAAQLHDIGKIAIPEAILNKPGRLDALEWAFMQTHTIVGERIISAAPALAEVGKLVRSSHERYDGTGYPDKLIAEAIPLGSRIIFVCDAFDAITSERSYQAAKTVPVALEEMQSCSGSQFDPQVLAAFCEVVEEAPEPVLTPS